MANHQIPKYCCPNSLNISTSGVEIQGIPILDLVETYGTPLYVYDGNSICDAITKINHYLPDFELFYSVKANPSLGLSKLIQTKNVGIEIASGGELKLAREAGFTPEKITFAGPAKTDAELSLAIDQNIAAINVESKTELMRLENIAKYKNVMVNACLRINIKRNKVNSPEIMAGKASRFGIDEETVFELVDTKKLKHVNLKGIHVYTASQILNSEDILINFLKTLSFAEKWNKENLALEVISFGGGFGIPYSENDLHLDLSYLGKSLSDILQTFVKRTPNHSPRFILELGRFIVAQSGFFLTKVIDVKISRGETFVSTDGGINHFIRPTFMNLNHPLFVVNKLKEPELTSVNIGGPLCTPFDLLARDVYLPKMEYGDLVCILNAGAYGYSLSMLNFLSHPTPAEILVFNANSYLLRERGDLNQYIKTQIIPTILG